jgi:hypothetical protein
MSICIAVSKPVTFVGTCKLIHWFTTEHNLCCCAIIMCLCMHVIRRTLYVNVAYNTYDGVPKHVDLTEWPCFNNG